MAIVAIWHEKIITLEHNGAVRLPSHAELSQAGLAIDALTPHMPRTLAGEEFAGLWLQDLPQPVTADALAAKGLRPMSMRELYHQLPTDQMGVVCYYYHFLHWLDRSRFCGHCASPLPPPGPDTGRECRECHQRFYAQISPAIIVGVVRNDKLLLAQHKRHATSGYRSLLAGFVEPQESLEECVLREIHEEVGLKVSNLRYWGSQPWPFPGSLMIGYFAEGESDILIPDGDEILAADWYPRDQLPLTPGSFSIAGKMISWFQQGGDPRSLGATMPLEIG